MKILNKQYLIKAIIYRLIASIFIFFISYILSNKMVVSVIIAISEFIFKALLYYVYEVFFNKITEKKG